MAISRAQLVKELEPGLNALFGLEYKQYGEQWAEIFDTDIKDGQSITTLDVGSAATTSMFTVVRNANDPENKDQSAAGCNFIVTIAPGSALYN